MTNRIELHQFQAHLAECFDSVEAGDTLVVCKDQEPIAELRPVKKLRPVGLGRGQITLAPNCFDPLPEDVIEGFEGNAG